MRRLLPWSLVCLAACGSSLRPLQDQTQEPQKPEVVVVKVAEHIGTPELALLHRVLREASAASLKAVVVELDGAGGSQDDPADLEALLDRIQQIQQVQGPEIVAWVKGRTQFNGTYLALVCNRLFMAPDAHLGL